MPMGQMQKTIMLNVGTTEDLWPYRVVDEIQKVMEAGKIKYPDDRWKGQSVEEHIKHALNHLKARKLTGIASEDHLAHAFTRLMMAVAIERGYVKEDIDA